MITTTYSAIRDKAAELAGRTRDKIPLSEATMLLGFIAGDLLDVWNGQIWPELTPAPEEVETTDRLFSKRIGEEDEMGDILGVWTANPLATTRYRQIDFEEVDEFIRVWTNLGAVWVEFMLPAPDLLQVDSSELEAYEIPRRFANYLAMRGAAHLLGADGQTSTAAAWVAMAEAALAREVTRLPAAPYRRACRVRVATVPTVTTATATNGNGGGGSHTADSTEDTADSTTDTADQG